MEYFLYQKFMKSRDPEESTTEEESSTDSEAEDINTKIFNEWKAVENRKEETISTALRIHLDNFKRLGQRQLMTYLVFGYIKDMNKNMLLQLPMNIKQICFLFLFYDFKIKPFREFDKNAPDTPISPWYMFRDKRRPELKLKMPNIRPVLIDDIILKEFDELSKQENKMYRSMYRTQIILYKSQFIAYKQTAIYRVFKRECAEWRQWHGDKLVRDMLRRQKEERIARQDPNWKAKQLKKIQDAMELDRKIMQKRRNARKKPQ
eukprot:429710_1